MFGNLGDLDPLLGIVVNNKYKIEKHLGDGAYGKIYILSDKDEKNQYLKFIN